MEANYELEMKKFKALNTTNLEIWERLQEYKNKKENDSIVKLVLASNYNNLAISSSNLKNFDSAISYYNKALKYVNVEENRLIYYNNIGDALISQKNFTLAKKYLNLALASKDSISYARALNNLARAKFLENKNELLIKK